MDGTTVTTLDLLAAHPFLEGVPSPWLERLSQHARRAVYHGGRHLFAEGEPARKFWLIRDGRVSLELSIPGRGEVSIEHIGTGSVLGWSWMFTPYRWHYTAVAAEHVVAVEFDGPAVRRLFDAEPALGYELTRRFSAVLVDRLEAARRRLVELYAPAGPWSDRVDG